MSGGSEIKNVLTLDVTKFTSAIDRATGGLDSLDKHLAKATKGAGGFDKTVTTLADGMSLASSKFRLLDQTLDAFVSRIAETANRFDSLGARSKNAASGVDAFGNAVKRTTSINADQWLNKYSRELDRLAPALKQAVSSIVDFDRANIAASESADKAAKMTVAAKLKSLEAERTGNRQIIAEREALVAELNTLQGKLQSRADGNAAVAARYFGRNYAHGEPYRQEAAQNAQAAQVAAQEAAAIDAVIKELKWKNAEIDKSIKLIHDEDAALKAKSATEKRAAEDAAKTKQAEAAAGRAAREAAAESARAARQAAQERMRAAREAADYERAQAQSLAQMWKGMGQLWAASKIERGLAAGVDKASEFQKADMRVKLLNLPTAEYEEFKKKAFDITREEKYLSTLDAMQARLDALTSIGANHKEVIDNTMGSALRNAQVMMASGYEHGNRSDLVKNLYGFAEARQVMDNPEKVKESFDIARRMGVASGGKINIADLETVARNIGDLRQTMSSEGWMSVAALMEQFKVAGSSGHGGAGAGVQSVGTILKMMSLYAAGKPVTDIAAVQLLGAGVMNDAFDMTNFKQGGAYNKQFQKMIKTSGFKNSEEMANNPVQFFSGLRGQVLDYTKQNAGQFYTPGADQNSEAAEAVALKRFFAKMGLSQKTVDGMLIMMNPGFIKRSQDVLATAKNSADENKSVENMKQTWANAVDEMKAGAVSLAAAFEPVLKPLALIPKLIGDILAKAAELVRNNPLAAQMGLIGVAAGGVTLAVKGTLATFGMLGSATAGIRTLLAGMTGLNTTTAAASGIWATLRAGVMAAMIQFPKLVGMFDGVTGAIARVAAWIGAPFAALGNMVGSTASIVAKIMGTVAGIVLKGVSLIGNIWLAFDLGYLIGTWVSDVQIGTNTIGEHFQNMLLNVEVGWKSSLLKIKEKWIDFLALVGGKDYLSESADRKELEAERKKLATYKSQMKIAERQEFVGPPEPTALQRAAEDLKNGKGIDKGGKAKGGKLAFDPTAAFASGHRERSFENLFTKAFERIAARAEETQLKIDALLNGEPSYEKQARADVFGKWAGGQFDEGNDPKNRGEFLKNGVRYDTKTQKYYRGKQIVSAEDAVDWNKKGKDGRTLAELSAEERKVLELNDAHKALAFAKERFAAVTEEADTASERFASEGLAKETDAMRALRREFAREEGRNPEAKRLAADPTSQYAKDKAAALANRSRLDAASYAFDTTQKNKDAQSKFITDASGRVIEDAERTRNEHQRIIEKFKTDYAGLAAQINRSLEEVRQGHAEDSDEVQKLLKDQSAAAAAYAEGLTVHEKEMEEALLTPVQKLALEWKKVNTQIDQMESSWASGFLDTLTSTINGGKADWRNFLIGMATDVEKLLLKNMFGDAITGATNGFGNWLKKQFSGAASGWDFGPGNSGDKKEGNIFSTMIDKAGSALKDFWGSLTGATSAADGNAASLATNVTALGQNIAKTVAGTTAEATATSSMITLSAAANAAATALYAMAMSGGGSSGGGALGGLVGGLFGDEAGGAGISAGGSDALAGMANFAANGAWFDKNLAMFANGGAFTNTLVDSPTLFKFANGGQFGMMGEAGPEAIMPLSRDASGRLGVTVNGGQQGQGGQVVNISIVVNKDGSSKGEKSGDDTGGWSQVANRIKAVVQEEMVAQQRPGGLLYK